MEKILKELKEELLNKEMTLLELDNKVQSITGTTSSLFDDPDEIEGGCYVYYIDYSSELDEHIEIAVDYTILEDNSDKLEIKVKVDVICFI